MNPAPIILSGCAPVPIAHYLKALGVLRLVAEQADPATPRHAWPRRGTIYGRHLRKLGGMPPAESSVLDLR